MHPIPIPIPNLNPTPNLNPDLNPNSIFGTTYSQPNYNVPYGSAQALAPSSWQQGPDPQAQSTWQQGPYPQTQSTWQQGPYSQAQSTWQQGPYQSPYPSTQSTWQQGPYQVPDPSAQSTWQQGPYPQAQSMWQQGHYQGPDPPAQSTWQQGPSPQAQSTWQQGHYQSPDPPAQSTWQQGSYQSPYPQAESTWQQGHYPPILGGGSHSQAQSTWQSNPYPQSQSIIGSESNSQTQSIPQAQPSAPSEGGPSLQIKKKIPLARINIDEETFPYFPKVIIRKVERVVDPDSESSSVCCACRQRIFSTPSITFSRGNEENLFLHEQCTTLPLQYLHELHPHHPLLLINHLLLPPLQPTEFTCHNCNQICGTSFYQCSHLSCNYRLDLLCVLQLKIKHRSHKHALTLIRLKDSCSLTCGACNSKHESESEPETDPEKEKLTLSYLCSLCGYWIHPDCASLLNALHYKHHRHSLFLIYNLPTSPHSKCFICFQLHKATSGVFVCLKCTNYLVHINCAVQDPHTFKPVLMRDAKACDLGRLPMANEHTSLIPYIRHDISSDGDGDDDDGGDSDPSKIHEHPLIFHESEDEKQSYRRVCNACVQYISPPFYRCSECPDFFLHECCARLPALITHPAHAEHILVLHSKAPKTGFSCRGCHLRCNGFAYSCETCDDFTLDVVCGLINPAITHEPHKSTHILFMSRSMIIDDKCSCCNSILNGICYECSSCPSFKLHVRCALLPKTVSHDYDQHPLRLTTKAPGGGANGAGEFFCEVCEERIDIEQWNYSCSECDQWFHVDCIPSVDQLSRIKLGSRVRVDVHGCPVALVRRDDSGCISRKCGSCRETLRLGDDGLAYECCDCFFGLHQNCANKHFF
ncbi:uncharacterized protein LOC125189525 [Salvia hispanica]|uniref:uncharacterized protein LOC125189525 n=1 Tax=Salvia hispanica TaxID=49212 RepID=UPI00200958C6|nr:uncharacterized protein LOC125189525 [Salvia hispanica]